MAHRLAFAFALLVMSAVPAAAQQPTPLLPAPAEPGLAAPSPAEPPPASSAPAPAGRDFCGQSVTARPADPASVPDRYRRFVGIFSDAAWSPLLCAALIVETIADDGAATITYVFGPIGPGNRAQAPGGVLHGAGIVKDGALLFQNSDGSQYAFQPFYDDLGGRWTTPKGQTYEAIFKRTY